eukprot:6193665-Pleurochrysis_carterae.AAC.2
MCRCVSSYTPISGAQASDRRGAVICLSTSSFRWIVISDLGAFGCCPARGVLRHGLLTGPRVDGQGGHRESAAVTTDSVGSGIVVAVSPG